MHKLLKPMIIGAILAFSTPLSMARDVTFMAAPKAGVLPLFVLQAKAADFLPEGTNIILKTVPPTSEAMSMALKNQEVDFATIFHVMGAKLYSNGMTHLQLAGIHAWGGMAILSKTSIEPGDWDALKGTTGLVAGGTQSPHFKISMLAMKVNGINPLEDILVAGASVHDVFEQMKSPDNAPDFVIMAEPQLSHGLIKMENQNWDSQYHVFADSAQSVSAFGIPLGSLWIVGEQEDSAAIVAGFDKAVDYMMDSQNRAEVATILTDGFNSTFNKSAPSAVFENLLDRQLLRMNYKSAAAIEAMLRINWGMANLDPSRDIIWHGNDFKVPDKAVLVSELLPRHVGSAIAHYQDLGLTQKTFMAALRIRRDVHAEMINNLTTVRELESTIFDAYLENDWAAVESNLEALAAARLEASILQLDCIRRTMEEYDPVDVEKLRQFHIDNEKVIAAFGGL